ncbi:MAG: cytochrome c oxidase subunit 4 [Actinomycetota bacterium]
MRLYARVVLGLALFLVVAGVIYGSTSHEYVGTLLFVVAAAGLALVGLFVRRAVRVTARETRSEEHAEEEPHVTPTIWPFVLSLAGVALVLGAIVSTWLLAIGAVLFVTASVGWFADTGRQWGDDRHGSAAERHHSDEGSASQQ